jgi:hypothetical protein
MFAPMLNNFEKMNDVNKLIDSVEKSKEEMVLM